MEFLLFGLFRVCGKTAICGHLDLLNLIDALENEALYAYEDDEFAKMYNCCSRPMTFS
jgi:hypothetical protein